MTDDALARALEENRRRSEVMADAQRYGPPAPREAAVPDLDVEPGVRAVPLPAGWEAED